MRRRRTALPWMACATLVCAASCGRSPLGDGATPPVDAGTNDAVSEDGTTTIPGTSCSPGVAVAVPAAERVPSGNPLLPPKWAFGVLWGSYYDQIGSTYAQGGNVLDAAHKVRAEYGGDLMWIDSSWLWHDYEGAGAPYYVCFAFDPLVFPDPKGMIAALQADHFHFGVWEWPWMDHGCGYFDTAVANRYFVMNGAQPALATGQGWHGDPDPAAFDFTSPSAVAWWTSLNEPFTEWGLDFLKLDTTAAQQDTPVMASGGTLADPTKSYEHERNRAAYEATRLHAAATDPVAQLDGARGFILPKAGSPANDQLPGWWTDDTPATFAGLQTEMGRASQLDTPETAAYWCGDTGGYSGTPTDELYARWLEYSTFTPLQELFGSKTNGPGARFPWLFGTTAQQIAAKYITLRYELLPFRYSNALAAYEVTPVAYPVAWIGSSQLLVGSGASQLLVQPVTTAGATTASVAFPAGATWIHYFTGARYAGGTSATVAAPLDEVPLFVKAGAIIPTGPPVKWVGEQPADPLTLDVYPSGATRYTLYEDDGVSEGYLGGAYSTTLLSADDTSGHVVVSIGAQATARYGYAGQLSCRTYVLEIHDQPAPAQVVRDGNAEPALTAAAFAGGAEGWTYDAATRTAWARFPLESSASARVTFE